MKTINRTIYATTATVYAVNPEKDTTTKETVVLNGRCEEKDFIKSTPYVYKVENITVKEAGRYSMDISMFMEHAEKGVKPTTRTRYVTATVKETFADVLYVDTKTNAVETIKENVTGCATEKQMLKKVSAGLLDNVKAVSVKEVYHSESKYFMLESDFMKLATYTPIEK